MHLYCAEVRTCYCGVFSVGRCLPPVDWVIKLHACLLACPMHVPALCHKFVWQSKATHSRMIDVCHPADAFAVYTCSWYKTVSLQCTRSRFISAHCASHVSISVFACTCLNGFLHSHPYILVHFLDNSYHVATASLLTSFPGFPAFSINYDSPIQKRCMDGAMYV